MDFSFIVPVLALLTLLIVAVLALFNKKKTDDRRHDPSAPTSTLAKDGPQGGVDLLQDDERRPR